MCVCVCMCDVNKVVPSWHDYRIDVAEVVPT